MKDEIRRRKLARMVRICAEDKCPPARKVLEAMAQIFSNSNRYAIRVGSVINMASSESVMVGTTMIGICGTMTRITVDQRLCMSPFIKPDFDITPQDVESGRAMFFRNNADGYFCSIAEADDEDPGSEIRKAVMRGVTEMRQQPGGHSATVSINMQDDCQINLDDLKLEEWGIRLPSLGIERLWREMAGCVVDDRITIPLSDKEMMTIRES